MEIGDCDINPSERHGQYKTWVEKYRPANLDEIVYQNEITSSLKNMVCRGQGQNLPNFLFYGPPGTGKTSTILALSRQLFRDQYSDRILELNASDERGIQVIREKVKNFAQKAIGNSPDIPAIKIIILDECDSMTKDAQSALRRIMEKYCQTTRFCLICNYVSKIIDPIVSRCTVFRFKPLKTELIKSTLQTIAQKEGFHIAPEAIETLINVSEGDLRRSITLLQTLSLIVDDPGTTETGGAVITEEEILEIAGAVPSGLVLKFFNVCRSKSYSRMIQEVESLIYAGYSGGQFLSQLQHWVATADDSLLDDRQKASICMKIASTDKRLLDGGDEYLQLLDVGTAIIKSF